MSFGIWDTNKFRFRHFRDFNTGEIIEEKRFCYLNISPTVQPYKKCLYQISELIFGKEPKYYNT